MIFLLLYLLVAPLAHSEVRVRVDPVLGDDESCLSVPDIIRRGGGEATDDGVPCETINYALTGNYTNEYYSTDNCSEAPILFSDIVISLSSDVHSLTEQLRLVTYGDVTFEGDGSASIECVSFPNYQFRNFDNIFACGVSGLTFNGVVFERCGPVPSNVFIYNSTNILFQNCIFRGNTGSSLQLRFVDSLTLINTSFIGNMNNATPISNNNETSIDDLYNIIQTSGGLTYIAGAHRISVIISNCSFISNRASSNLPNDTRPVLLKQNGHGGGMLIRLSGTTGGSFVIENSFFINNSAQVDGGAVYVSYSDKTENTSINILNSSFIGNSIIEAAGGAISLNSFNFTFGNKIRISHCIFERNHGSAGGGVSMALYDSNLNTIERPDSIHFTDSVFNNNSAYNEGTAVGLFSLVHVDQVGFLVHFNNCRFENNTSIVNGSGSTGDTSAVAAFRFPTLFDGTNVFFNNTGGGIMLLNTRMQAHGDMRFEYNNAIFGGGIMMDDRCLLEVTPNLNMTFLNNYASESGGAIYVEFPPIRFVIDIFNRLCFLQYNDGGSDVPPQEWENVNIKFINNTARISGAAIYASDMQRCTWLGNVSSDNSTIFKLPKGIKSPFYYDNNMLELRSGNIVQDEELATAPLRLHSSINFNTVQPGEYLSITLFATDQLNNSREAVWSLNSPDQDTQLDALSANNDTFIYTVPALIYLQDNLLNLNFSLLKTLGMNDSISVRVSDCHPGYVHANRSRNTSLCTCDNSNSDIIRCDEQNRYVYLRSGIWGRGRNGRLLTTRVLPGYIYCDAQGRLPGCRFQFDNETGQCQEGRIGDLCGQCKEGRGVSLDLQICSEVSCSVGLTLFLLLSCLAVLIFCCAILYINVTIPNELRGFLFYAQVIGLIYRPFSVSVTRSGAIDPVAVVVNVLGFSVPIPFCISQSLGAEYVALFGYIPPLIMIAACLGFVLGAHFVKRFAHHSAIKGITCLSYFIYKYLADTSFVFLSCAQTPIGFRFQYDGSVSCLSPYFGTFFFLSLLIVTFFVAPLPFGVCYISTYRGPQIFRPFADVLTDGLKDNRRLWGGWDVGRRLIFVFISFFVVIERPSLIVFIMSLAALVVLIVHIIVKPFEKEYINVIEALILLDLVLVTGAFLSPDPNSPAITIGYIFMFLPYLYCIGYVIYRIGFYIRMRIKVNKSSSTAVDRSEGSPTSDDSAEEKKSLQNASPPPLSSSSGSATKTQSTGLTAGTGSSSSTKNNTAATSSTAPSVGGDNSKETGYALREPLLDDDEHCQWSH
ncbi:PREDICTED: uncharacterized protein LOC109581757 [Amphimedon queenslandica]|uniref:Right handed beta helix domain-containing protein n=1 Tax=Amphimedon queenslandica TaxID=400682 RepID=A0A1X7UXT4_AMPQE|nr:PREDICTED: uncharacterized protein LOC109581757 [Amphimedon queenslandica]|eukprot:XP_019851702.1 PREDICTED: uncharacterized protein LOC109581757 [Amphimedon queenslandica]